MQLDLSGNRLENLGEGSLEGLSSLSSLALGNNSITVVEEAVFVDLPLTRLDLSQNKLQELPPAVGRLFKLVSLNVSHNLIECVPTVSSRIFRRTPTFVLSRLPNLREADISWNRLQAVSPFPSSPSSAPTGTSLHSFSFGGPPTQKTRIHKFAAL